MKHGESKAGKSSDLSDVERRTLDLLRQNPQGLRASEIGMTLFHPPGRWMSARSTSSNRYARAAGAVLARLKRRGMADVTFRGFGFVWRAA